MSKDQTRWQPAFEWDLHELGPREEQEPKPSIAAETMLRITAADGYPLAATLFEAVKRNGITVQINSAYAVPREYYAAYARYLAAQGFTVLTHDYRGIGGSRTYGWRDDAPTLRDWGERDVPAVIDWLKARYPKQQLVHVGHSIGGQLLGLAPNNHKVAALLTISSQAAYWKLFDFPYNLLAWAWFHAVVPGVTFASAIVPALRRNGFDAPRGAALQWARWGRNPHYISDERGEPLREHFHRYTGRVRLYHITDDHEFAPRRAVEALAGFYANAQVEVVHRTPSDWRRKHIGHFGFFRASMPREAWRETARWLADSAVPHRRTVKLPPVSVENKIDEEAFA